MSALTHTVKIHIAKRLRTKAELIEGVPIFETRNWERRKAAIAMRVKRHEAIRRYHAEQRKASMERHNATSPR